MTVYLIYYTLILALGLFALVNSHYDNVVRHWRGISSAILGGYIVMLAVLRHETVGIDLVTYLSRFDYLKTTTWSQIFTDWDEYGYYLLMKTIQVFSTEHQALIIVTGIITMGAVAYYIYRDSKDIYISYLCLIPMNYMGFMLCVLRQSIAMSILFFSYKYIKERKLIKFLILVLIAQLFHRSAIIFVVAYFVYPIKISKFYMALSFTGFAIAFVFRRQIVDFFRMFYSDYTFQNSSNISALILYFAVVVVGFIFCKDLIALDETNRMYIHFAVISTFFQIFSLELDVIFRIGYYFNISMIVLIPEILRSIKDRRFAVLGYGSVIVTMMLAYFFFTYPNGGIYPYLFFWQGG